VTSPHDLRCVILLPGVNVEWVYEMSMWILLLKKSYAEKFSIFGMENR
jgi:hypothetical protein